MRCRLCGKEFQTEELTRGYCLGCEELAYDAWLDAVSGSPRLPEVGA